MTPYYEDSWLSIFEGDCRTVLAEMPAESVHCVVTSPPYWGLRDYGVVGQLGLEPTLDAYVEAMVAVFGAVRRVLRKDGTLWLNLGDSYAGSWGAQSRGNHTGDEKTTLAGHPNGLKLHGRQIEAHPHYPSGTGSLKKTPGLKPKDLVGIPWRVAFALQADGWYLRRDVIWSKPNPMPESVTDRPTTSHEYLFLLAKSPRYFYDEIAVREPDSGQDHDRRTLRGQASLEPSGGLKNAHGGIRRAENRNGTGRNLRSVWTIATQPYAGAHFATFPEALAERCIKAGTSERGVCPECGAPWERVVERAYRSPTITTGSEVGRYEKGRNRNVVRMGDGVDVTTTGWLPSCSHETKSGPATVLDPFAGSGTTGRVAQRLSRRAVLIDLNPAYLVQALNRNRDIPLGLETA